MKQYITILLCLLLLAAMTACAASPADATSVSETSSLTVASSEPTVPETQPTEAPVIGYDALLERFFFLVSHPYDVTDLAPGELGIIEAARTMEDNAPNAIGYYIGDLSGDGIPELAVGTLPEYGGQINVLYTLVDGQPQLVFEGWYRSSYRYLKSGLFFYCGASSASETGQGFFSLSQDATTLTCEEFYFTHAGEEDASLIQVYYNTTGSWDIGQSQLTQIPAEDFWSWNPECGDLSMTTFLDYRLEQLYDTSDEPLHVQWGNSVVPGLKNYREYVVDEEYADQVLFTTDRTLTNFELSRLTILDVSDDGVFSYSAEPVYSQDCLTPGCPLLIQICFPGDMSAYGISFVDTYGDGQTHWLRIMVSGKDGSLLLENAN